MNAVILAGWFPYFFKSQFYDRIPVPQTDFSGQTVIVTGSNVGLGLEAARHVARLGASKLILAVRTVSKGEAAAEDIVASCGIPASRVEVWSLEMGNKSSILAFAERVRGLERLDAAILNAGVMDPNNFALVEGVEYHIAINTINAMLLTLLLLPKMRESAKLTGRMGRLSHVGSDMMYIASLSEPEALGDILENLNVAERTSIGGRYALSKLLYFYALRDLTTRYSASDLGVIVNDMTPGACASTLFRDESNPTSRALMGGFMNLVQRTTEVGARTLVQAVETDLTQEAHGKFLMNAKIGYDGLIVTSQRGKKLASRWNDELWPRLEEMVPGCTKL